MKTGEGDVVAGLEEQGAGRGGQRHAATACWPSSTARWPSRDRRRSDRSPTPECHHGPYRRRAVDRARSPTSARRQVFGVVGDALNAFTDAIRRDERMALARRAPRGGRGAGRRRPGQGDRPARRLRGHDRTRRHPPARRALRSAPRPCAGARDRRRRADEPRRHRLPAGGRSRPGVPRRLRLLGLDRLGRRRAGADPRGDRRRLRRTRRRAAQHPAGRVRAPRPSKPALSLATLRPRPEAIAGRARHRGRGPADRRRQDRHAVRRPRRRRRERRGARPRRPPAARRSSTPTARSTSSTSTTRASSAASA